MSARVATNGFGRIGRLAVQAARGGPGLALVRVNEPHGDAATSAAPADLRLRARAPAVRGRRRPGRTTTGSATAIGLIDANRLVELARTVAASLP